MIAPTWAEIAERARLLLWQKLRDLRRLYRRRRFAIRERRRSKVLPLPQVTVLRDPHGEYGYIDGGYRSSASGREAWENEEYPPR